MRAAATGDGPRRETTWSNELVDERFDDLLAAWPFDPEGNVRMVRRDDGRSVLQVRVDQGAFQGILQMLLDGRPDGARPHGCDFVLDYYQERLGQTKSAAGGNTEFSLDPQACQELFDEAWRLYQRYLLLLQLQDYERVIRDTERNMTLFSFVNRYAERSVDRENLERWWPYILRVNAEARALKAVSEDDYAGALELVDAARQRIEDLEPVAAEEFHSERDRSRRMLGELVEVLRSRRPLSRVEQLQERLRAAVSGEKFELAAVLRDRLRELAADDPEQTTA